MAFPRIFTYKIQKRSIAMLIAILFLLTYFPVVAQPEKANKYGLQIVETRKDLKKIVAKDSTMEMLDIKKLIPSIQLDLKYCGTDNFMKQRLYPAGLTSTYLRKPAAMALQKVQQALNAKGMGLKIWDAYRPYSVTEKMWEPVKDDRYAADPKFGSGHNRGIAVDLTIIDLATGKELDMGTGFDHFSDTAHSNFKSLPQNILTNRNLLRSLMEQNGFKVLDTEWWHFYLPDSKKYALMNISFKQLKN
ncbi:MAG: peptidase M15 [Sphingobacteriales bacterium]|nr:MAG: peptidase M15 [Sphingobacteriales bacterium]